MRYLNRANTPLPPEIWDEIDAAAISAMTDALSARRFLDLEGPYGVGMTSLEVGVDEFCREPGENEAAAVLSRAISVPMLRKNFKLNIRQVEAHLHMGQRFEWSPIEDAGGRRPAGRRLHLHWLAGVWCRGIVDRARPQRRANWRLVQGRTIADRRAQRSSDVGQGRFLWAICSGTTARSLQ
jgi:hypothetical protein